MPTFSERVLRAFPPPAFLTMPATGVDLSDASVKWIELKQERRFHEVGRYGKMEIPHGVIVGGQIHDSRTLKDVLQKMRSRLGMGYVVCSLPEEHTYTVTMRLPAVALRDLRESVLFSLDQYVPLAPSELVFDYEVARAPLTKDQNYELIVTAVPRQLVMEYEAVFLAADLVPLAFEVESQAVARAVLSSDAAVVAMVVDMGELRTGISIVCGGQVWFSSTLSSGGAEVERLLGEALKCSTEESRKTKEEDGFLATGKNSMVRAATLATAYAPLRDEIAKHLEYWDVNGRLRVRGVMPYGEDGAITSLLLCGGEANVPGLSAHLSKGLGLAAEIANPWRNVLSFDETIPLIPRPEALRFTTAIGLALRSVSPRVVS